MSILDLYTKYRINDSNNGQSITESKADAEKMKIGPETHKVGTVEPKDGAAAGKDV